MRCDVICKIVILKHVLATVVLEVWFVQLSIQAPVRCAEGKSHKNCSVKWRDMSMWCDDSNLVAVPHPMDKHTSKLIKSQAPPSSAKIMHFNSSCLMSIDPATMSHYSKLRTFNADNNDLATIDANTFKKCRRLGEVVLSRNKISTLDNDAFAGLADLRVLNLSGNSLTEINEDVFAPLSHLEVLDLSNNNIAELSEKAFRKLTLLQTLILSGNQLTEVTSRHFINLNELQTLDLSGNSISLLDEDFLVPLEKLESINLSHNNLSCLDKVFFKDNTHLTRIQLNDNQLKQPKEDWFRDLIKRQPRPGKNAVSLSGNPWLCDCNSHKYEDFLNEQIDDDEWEEMLDIWCSPPDAKEIKKMSSLIGKFAACPAESSKECPGQINKTPPDEDSSDPIVKDVGAEDDLAPSTRPYVTTTSTKSSSTATLSTTTPQTPEDQPLFQGPPTGGLSLNNVVIISGGIVVCVFCILLTGGYVTRRSKGKERKRNSSGNDDNDSGFGDQPGARSSLTSQTGTDSARSSSMSSQTTLIDHTRPKLPWGRSRMDSGTFSYSSEEQPPNNMDAISEESFGPSEGKHHVHCEFQDSSYCQLPFKSVTSV
ncbi:uncharacterized protein LOC143469244 [Clavelina lepadiformis]|uniref:uncharacterized protein LOC143469244 n=1 Tax=Clavelina lepadiformis TaxID=159417 RepID=UPI0040438FCB